jgi:hypothetical protein
MLHIIYLFSFCPPKIDVPLKITIEFMINYYCILIQCYEYDEPTGESAYRKPK